jgi:sigma-E factor negative regulatory protein RseB
MRCFIVVRSILAIVLYALECGLVLANGNVNEWLVRIQAAGRNRAYIGTYVVSSDQGVSTARIWHVCDGTQQMERVETLSGAAQTTLRHNDQVVIHNPATKTTLVERRQIWAGIDEIVRNAAIPEHYNARIASMDRVAGLDAKVLELTARDKWRYSYRVWMEKSTGLVLRMQTLDTNGAMLEELSFSDIQLPAPVKMENIQRLITAATDESAGNRVNKLAETKLTLTDAAWKIKPVVPGFQSVACYSSGGREQDRTQQCVYSDGLATVSVFSRQSDSSALAQGQVSRMGSTRAMAVRYDLWQLTFVGEVPVATLKAFAESVERQR